MAAGSSHRGRIHLLIVAALGLVAVLALLIIALFNFPGTGQGPSAVESLHQQALTTKAVLKVEEQALNPIRAAGLVAGIGLGLTLGAAGTFQRRRI